MKIRYTTKPLLKVQDLQIGDLLLVKSLYKNCDGVDWLVPGTKWRVNARQADMENPFTLSPIDLNCGGTYWGISQGSLDKYFTKIL